MGLGNQPLQCQKVFMGVGMLRYHREQVIAAEKTAELEKAQAVRLTALALAPQAVRVEQTKPKKLVKEDTASKEA